MVKQKDLVNSSVAEFLGCWAVGGKATLTLDTINGVTTVSFTSTPRLCLGPGDTAAWPRGNETVYELLATKQH